MQITLLLHTVVLAIGCWCNLGCQNPNLRPVWDRVASGHVWVHTYTKQSSSISCSVHYFWSLQTSCLHPHPTIHLLGSHDSYMALCYSFMCNRMCVCARAWVCSFLCLFPFAGRCGGVPYTHRQKIVTFSRPAVQFGSALLLGGIMMLNYSPQFE